MGNIQIRGTFLMLFKGADCFRKGWVGVNGNLGTFREEGEGYQNQLSADKVRGGVKILSF